MRYKSVLLVNFYYPESGYGDRLNFPPLGIGYLSEYLTIHDIPNYVLDMGTGKNMDDAEELLQQNIREHEPNLIAISLNSICFFRSISIINTIHNKFPQIPIVVGGPHASSRGGELLKEHDSLKFVIVREGEKSLYQLCKGDDFENISSLCWKQDSVIHENKSSSSDTLSDFPYPKYDKYKLHLYEQPDTIGILTSRGCPYACAFCQQSSLLGKRWRGRNPDDVIDEVRYWKEQGKKKIHIIDDNFALDRHRLLQISRLVVRESLDGIEYVIVGGIRIDQTDEEILLALKQMGVKVIPFGVESGSDKILKFIKKGFTIEQANRVIGLATSMDFDVKLFFIIGLPIETVADVQTSFDLALKYPIYNARFFNFIPYPDTYLMNWLKENGAHFFYQSDEYMGDFKKFQRIPIFECPGIGMNREEKIKALEEADEIVKIIEERRQDNEGSNFHICSNTAISA